MDSSRLAQSAPGRIAAIIAASLLTVLLLLRGPSRVAAEPLDLPPPYSRIPGQAVVDVPLSGQGVQSAVVEKYCYGQNLTDYAIPDTPGGGTTTQSLITIDCAPDGARVTKVVYAVRIVHPWVSELSAWVLGTHLDHFWFHDGEDTDNDEDDDAADDDDIEIIGRVADTVFDDEIVNKTWRLCVGDGTAGNTGYIDRFSIYVYYDCEPLLPATPAGPSPADSAKDQSVDVDLNWANAEHAESYDLYFGATYPPPYLTNVAVSSYPLSRLDYGTHYRWKVVARNSCGTTAGPIWDFTTLDAPTATPTRTPTPTHTVTATPTRTSTHTSTAKPTATRTVGTPVHGNPLYLPLLRR